MAKVLVVDDDIVLRQLYQEVLQNAGIQVDTAADGEEGLAKIKSGDFDLALLDIMMPKLDGLSVLSRFQTEEPKPKKIPVIVIWTNLSHDPATKEALEKGAAAVLVKAELTPTQIISLVQKYLPR